jgi:NAD(P)-dependent dehydrogenase (short-subunit alcohol dehydrogenase family)
VATALVAPARVHLVGIDQPKLKAAVEEIGPDKAFGTVADVADESAVAEVVRAGVDRFGRYDVLFSNAGNSGEIAEIVDYPADVFARTLAIHVLGVFHMLKYTTPNVNDGGSVIITSSVVGLIGFGDLSAYVAAKHGQVGLMRSAAKELAERRIRVNGALRPRRSRRPRSTWRPTPAR